MATAESVKMDRTDLLIASVLGVCRLRDRWQETGVPRISNEFAEAMDDLCELWDDGEIPADCRILFDFYPALRAEWKRFGEYASERNPSPIKPFWDSLRLIESLLINREDRFIPPALETVSELMSLDPKPSYRFVCYVYSHKGMGPFMRNKEPVPSLAQSQHKWEQQQLGGKNDDGTWKKPIAGARDVVGEWFKQAGISPYDADGNMVSLAALERMKAGSRVEKRLVERASRLLHGMENGKPDESEGIGDLPPTRQDLDKGGGVAADEILPGVGDLPESDVPPEEGSLEAQIQAGEEAALAQRVFLMKDSSVNVTNRTIAETLGISINQVQRILRSREKGGA